jgi:sarcosine oxidase subunit beta
MSNKFDAIIIGGGIIGSAIAYEMAKSGKSVVCIEKNSTAGSGSTSNSCAIIRTHYSTLSGAALAKSNYYYWENWAEYLNAPEDETLAKYRETGCLFTCFKKNDYGSKLEEIANEIDIPYEVWSPAKMKKKLPIINPGHFYPPKPADDPDFGSKKGDMRYVLFFPRAGYVNDPMFATQNIQKAAERESAEFRFGHKVIEIKKDSNRVSGVTLDSGETINASIVVNASGPHSYKINSMAGVIEGMNIKTKALRVEVAHVPSPKGFNFEKDGYICSDDDISGYWRPEVGNKILIGHHENEVDPSEWVDPDDYNTEVTDHARLQALRAAQRFPEMGIPNNVQGIADLYDASDDWIPIYDKSDLPGFYMAVGTSGNQFKNAPVAGKMMNELINYVENGNDHDVNPLKFKLPNVDYELDMSFCSRKREINRESSFSVVG